MLKSIEKILFVAALLSILLSIYVYQTDAVLGTFIGLWVPTLLLLAPTYPWRTDRS